MSLPKKIGFILPEIVSGPTKGSSGELPVAYGVRGQLVPAGALPVKADNGSMSISLYNDQPADEAAWAVQALRITSVFPEVGSNAAFMNELSKAVARKRMTAKQLEDAIDNLVDNCKYPRFSISEVVSYDKKVRLYSHAECCEICSHGVSWNDTFDTVKVDGKVFWVKKVDVVNARNGIVS